MPLCSGMEGRNKHVLIETELVCKSGTSTCCFSHLVSERDDARQQSDEDVCVDAPFVRFVNDDYVIFLEQKILQHKTETMKKLEKMKVLETFLYRFFFYFNRLYNKDDQQDDS